MQEIHKEEMIASLSPYLHQELPFQGKAVLIFGHCNATEELTEYLQKQGVTPLAFLDNNPMKQGKDHQGIPIYPPEFICSYTPVDSLVLIASRYYAPMLQQIRQLGYSGTVVETVEYSTFQAFSTEKEMFDQKVQRVQKGYQILQGFREEWKNEHLILCPYRALGDVYWAMSYLEAYLEYHEISSYAVIVVGDVCRQVTSLFGICKVSVLPQKEMDSLLQAIIFTHEENAIVVQHDHLYTDVSLKMLHHHLYPLTDYFRDVVYGLPSNAVATVPAYGKEFSGKDRMPKGKSLILAPYANSIVEAPLSFWETMAKKYKEDGFTVYTNVLPEQSPVIGTDPLEIPIEEMRSAVEWAGYFASIRSGLCDVLHETCCEKRVVYPDYLFSTTKHKISQFYVLDGWDTILL